jgi:membrane fusion protein (multidrug efflux system)
MSSPDPTPSSRPASAEDPTPSPEEQEEHVETPLDDAKNPLWAVAVGMAVLFAVMLATLLLGGCSDQSGAAAPPPPDVSVVVVHPRTIPVMTELPGRTTAYLVAQVRARVDGIVLHRDFTEGADVTEGQRLYQIDPAPYRAALDSARATLSRARANVEATTSQAQRDEVLVAGNAVSKQALLNAVAARDQANADVASGLAAVQTAGINLGYTDIIAPITGRIGSSIVTQGAYVQASAATLMATIQQIDPIYVDLNQTSVEGLQLRQQVANGRLKLSGPDQAKVHLILEDGGEYRTTGTLQFTDITVDPTTDSVTVRAIFPNPQHVLLPGMFVRARIDQGTDDRAFLVPEDGVTHDRNGLATVLIVGADNKVTVQTVTATRTLGNSWVVESGLKDGDRVVVAGVQRTRPGMVVNPVLVQPPTSRPVAVARTGMVG